MSAAPECAGAKGDSDSDDDLFRAVGIDNDAEIPAKPCTAAPVPPALSPRALAVAFSVHNRQRERSVCFAPATPDASPPPPGTFDWQDQFDGRVTHKKQHKKHKKEQHKKEQHKHKEESVEELLAPPGPGDTEAVFGVALEEGVRRTGRISPDLPDVVAVCLAAVERDGLAEVGVFRVPGSLRDVARLRAAAQHGAAPDVAAAGDVHVATSLLKRYLRELPESLLAPRPDAAGPAADAAAAACRDAHVPAGAEDYRALVATLHEARRRVLYALCALLAKVAAAQERTRMGARNLGIVLSPSLHSDVETVTGLIAHFGACFDAERDAPRLPSTWPLLPPPPHTQ